MFKRLFGKKKNKPESLDEAKELLYESIREESFNKNVEEHMANCLELLSDTSDERVGGLLEGIYLQIKTLPLAQSIVALSVYASLTEKGCLDKKIIDELIEDYHQTLVVSKPFFDELDDQVKKGEEGDLEESIDVDSLYNMLLKDRELISEGIARSVVKCDHFSKYMIAILSTDTALIKQYKAKLKEDLTLIKEYIQSCYWLDRLLNLPFDEPIVVIDVDNHIGFEGRMSGVNDNFQLQHLLMGMPELNEHPAINDFDLSVANGTGIHMSNSIITNKWNMYNLDIIDQEDWEDIKIGPDKTFELEDHWIFSEATPSEIAKHNGHRVVLLGRTPVKKQVRLQRMFKNVKATVEVEKMLSDEEINTWLKLSPN